MREDRNQIRQNGERILKIILFCPRVNTVVLNFIHSILNLITILNPIHNLRHYIMLNDRRLTCG